MEFQDVVRRRRMVRNYADEPVDPAVVDRALGQRRSAPQRRLQPGLGVPGARHPRGRRAASGTPPPTPVELSPDELADGHDARAGGDRAVLEQGGVPRAATPSPTRAGPTEDEARWPVPFWHMDAAMASLLILQTAVDEGLGACFFGIPPERDARGPRGVRHPRRLRPGRRDHDRAPRRPTPAPPARPTRRPRKPLGRRRPPRSVAGDTPPVHRRPPPPGQRPRRPGSLGSETCRGRPRHPGRRTRFAHAASRPPRSVTPMP